MDTHLITKAFLKSTLFTLIALLLILLPFNHKEWFSVFDKDMVWSKYVLILTSIYGTWLLFKNYKMLYKDHFMVLLVLIFLFHLLSIIQSQDITSSVRYLMFLGAVVLTYPVFVEYFSDINRINRIVVLYCIAILLTSCFLFVQMYLQNNYGIAIGGIWPVPGYPTRFGSTFWDINHYGAYLASSFFLLLGILIDKFLIRKCETYRYFLIMPLFLILFALYSTSSRSATIGFASGLFLFIILSLNKIRIYYDKLNLLRIWLAAVSFSAIPFGIIIIFSDSIRNAFLYRSVSFFSHLFLLKAGLSVGMDNFLLGIGTNAFSAYFKSSKWASPYYYIDPSALNLKLPVHQLWLEVFAETGAVSFIVFVFFWFYLCATLCKIFFVKKDFIALGLLCGIITFLVGGLMYSYKGEFFWIFVLIASAYASKTFHNPFVNARLKDIFIAIICVVIFLSPVFYTIKMPMPFEIDLFYNPNLSVLYDMLRYIFDNYVYIARGINLMFYFSTALILFGILSRYFHLKFAVMIGLLILSTVSLFVSPVYLSLNWITIFIAIMMAGLALSVYSTFVPSVSRFIVRDKYFDGLFVILLIVFASGFYLTHNFVTKSYNSDIAFLSELSYNRGLMSHAQIFIESDENAELIYFYCDEVMKINRSFSKNNCILSDFALFESKWKNSNKSLIIGESGQVNILLEKLNQSDIDEVYSKVIITSGDKSMLSVERKF